MVNILSGNLTGKVSILGQMEIVMKGPFNKVQGLVGEC